MSCTRLAMKPPAFLPPTTLPFSLISPFHSWPRPFTTSATLSPSSSLSSLAHSINTKASTSSTLLSSTLSHIHSIEPHINAFLTLDPPETLPNVSQSLPLAGVPIAVKDNLCTSTLPTTAASSLLDDFYPAYTATAVERLLQAGAVLVGKTNLDEFGMGSSTENSAYVTTKNPWDLSKVPGGSSGGSAAAVAAGMVPLAIGSDTGGSIRQPAGFCGVTGLKPSYGRVSRYGLLAYASSLDTVGPIARSVEDCALALGIMAGEDGKDGTCVGDCGVDFVAGLGSGGLEGVVVGVIEEGFGEGVDMGVIETVKESVKVLQGLGAEVRTVRLGGLRAATAAYYVLAPAEASANLARYDGVRYGVREEGGNSREMYARSRGRGFGEEVRRRVMVGTYALSSGYYEAYYGKAQRVRARVAQRFREAFETGVDVLITPTSPTTAFGVGEKVDDALSMYLQDVMTIPASLAGLPALSVPCGFVDGLPVGMQIVAPFWKEEMMLRVGHAFQLATDHHLQTSDILRDSLVACGKV